MKFALFHSPVVGPSTWRWVGGALGHAGHEVVIPDLRSVALEGEPRQVAMAAASAVPGHWQEAVLVAHSGFGSLLPLVADLVGTSRVARMVFVDAGLPPCHGLTTPSADFLDHLRSLAVEGVLPRWSHWWGDQVMEVLVLEPDRRAAVEDELPEIPLAFFESAVEVPSGWCDAAGAYLLLSAPYRQDAEQARKLGWPVRARMGGHLDIVSQPDDVADDLLCLVLPG